MFDIQKFAGGGNYVEISGPMWYYLTTTGSLAAVWGAAYLPDGTTIEADANESMHWINATTEEDLPNGFTIVINGAYTTDTQTSPSVVELTLVEDKTVGDVVVTGTGASGLTLTIDGTNYTVNSSGKLEAPAAGEVLSVSVINTTKRSNNKLVSKTINYINPDAADSDVVTFMAALNSLSDNATVKGGLVVVEKRSIG